MARADTAPFSVSPVTSKLPSGNRLTTVDDGFAAGEQPALFVRVYERRISFHTGSLMGTLPLAETTIIWLERLSSHSKFGVVRLVAWDVTITNIKRYCYSQMSQQIIRMTSNLFSQDIAGNRIVVLKQRANRLPNNSLPKLNAKPASNLCIRLCYAAHFDLTLPRSLFLLDFRRWFDPVAIDEKQIYKIITTTPLIKTPLRIDYIATSHTLNLLPDQQTSPYSCPDER
ncbi:uncharacterized protein CLUP02_05723 [Colletotrichum lupini]|uniref:Uncharacterized protein n=1 Tax=Colletotrichum lupini TaxID=145971 RepID=A0A9Q8WEG7_9PEZI|nr:uncharacterized protein CLUP02_05723 [Colletotrichum lupini]UQC80241.1 hypothetical protein CLUP02_05723 [Colletotrichum lupini]